MKVINYDDILFIILILGLSVARWGVWLDEGWIRVIAVPRAYFTYDIVVSLHTPSLASHSNLHKNLVLR